MPELPLCLASACLSLAGVLGIESPGSYTRSGQMPKVRADHLEIASRMPCCSQQRQHRMKERGSVGSRQGQGHQHEPGRAPGVQQHAICQGPGITRKVRAGGLAIG